MGGLVRLYNESKQVCVETGQVGPINTSLGPNLCINLANLITKNKNIV